ncbi:flavin reductase [Streptomyces durbertensis]|uniref:Flavin reductase n=1 Tax=Streptomyces durbertensis TaxID=2448886 RepID=A0ABR6EA36_9ACTN|nr:flavin reductase family protein [Streptomyces durbertensis]MBB1242193.1 flavin reductase [Streptomyces durbertensis]
MTHATGTLPRAPETRAFRAAMGCFPTGVTLLTRGCGAETAVMTLNSLTSVSLDPLLMLVSVRAEGRIRPHISSHGSYAVNVLGAAQAALAAEFSRPDRPSGHAAMQRLGAVPGATGNAVMPGAQAYFECLLRDEIPAGDHVLLLGAVVGVSATAGTPDPLLFHQGRFTRLPPDRAETA